MKNLSSSLFLAFLSLFIGLNTIINSQNYVKLPFDIVTYDGETTKGGSNFASFQQNAIMTYNGYQYISYWNNKFHVCLSRKKMPNGQWEEIEFTDYTSSAERIADNHYTISFGICKNDGTIHIAFDHHNDDLNYKISIPGIANNPDEINWKAEIFNPTRDYLQDGRKEENITYPRFISKPNGDLLYECRIGWSGDGDSFLWEYSGINHRWQYLGEYLNGTHIGENAYINGIQYDPNNRLHVSWVWRETPDAQTNHDIYYSYSDDDGRHWFNAKGEHVGTINSKPLNINTEGIKIWDISTYRGLINQESQAVDSKGKIHILQSYIPEDVDNKGFWNARTNHGELHHIYQSSDGQWRNDIIAPSSGNRSEIAVDKNDNLYVVSPDYNIYFADAATDWNTWSLVDSSENTTATAEGLIDREALLDKDLLSFVFTHKDIDGKIITPYYLLQNSHTPNGNGLEMRYGHKGSTPLSIGYSNIDFPNKMIKNTSNATFISCEGELETKYAEEYTLYLSSKGNIKLWINNELLLETKNKEEHVAKLKLQPSHNYQIRLEGNYPTGKIKTTLKWSSKSQQKEIIPISNLKQQIN